MTYNETIDWMFAQLPMYQKIGASAHTKDLSNTILFCDYLDNPEHKFKSIHIGGTNGKGSTSSMLASVLQEAGYKVGLYTSPHLKDYRERIKINGQIISEEFVTSFISENKIFLEKHLLSFFEMTVGLAFDYFAKEKVDVALIEVGLGGRLDSTNIINPLMSVITNIGLDHVAILGNSLSQIASEKAGIIKKNTPIVIGQYSGDTKNVFIEKAEKMNAPIWFAQDVFTDFSYESDLKGIYQRHNIKTTLIALNVLKGHFDISEFNIKNGLERVVSNTGLLGRWQILNKSPFIVADTAHNKDGLQEVIPQLINKEHDTLFMVFGVVNDKDLEEIFPLLPKDATYFVSKPNVPRGLDEHVLAEKMKAYGFSVTTFASIPEAYRAAKSQASIEDIIYVGGSTFVVAEIV